MPRSWHDRYAASQVGDEQTNDFYRKIVADKKPYFMRYIYPALMKQYNTYIKNTERNALREFQMTVPELRALDNPTERQLEFLTFYDIKMPVGTNDCVMNKICKKIEHIFDGYLSKHNSVTHFDYNILKSNSEYSSSKFSAIKKLYKEYNNRIKNYMIFASNERIDKFESNIKLNMMNDEFNKECSAACSDGRMLCNIVLDLCYSKSSSRQFAWGMCGDEIIRNLLEHNNNIISYPVLDPNGDIDFGGTRYSIEKIKLEVDNGDSIE